MAIKPEDYFDLVMKGFAHLDPVESDEMTILTEDIFKFRWMARLRLSSFITLADGIDAKLMHRYLETCAQFAKKGRSKLGEPLVCNAVAMSENVSSDAVEYAMKRPQIRSSMDAFPIVVDLKTGDVYYYTGPIFYGVIYEKFEREYIDGHFALPLRVLAGRQ